MEVGWETTLYSFKSVLQSINFNNFLSEFHSNPTYLQTRAEQRLIYSWIKKNQMLL